MEIKDMTAQITNVYSDHPPFIPAPENAAPVIVIVEHTAKDPQALEKHLIRAEVIPTTRLASGINSVGLCVTRTECLAMSSKQCLALELLGVRSHSSLAFSHWS